MKNSLSTLRLAAPAAALLVLALASGHASSPSAPDATSLRDGAPLGGGTVMEEEFDLSERFPGAPYGVDPVVTGPVSREFRERQRIAGCDTAEWPRIPLVCFPG